MRQVYTPANAAEAHMLAHLLGQRGIVAHVHGEALQGAAGELPAGNVVQLLVSDEDYDKARELLLRWERADVPPSEQQATPGKRFRFVAAAVFLLIGIASGWALKAAMDNSRFTFGDSQLSLDQNGDGRDDVTYFYRPGSSTAHRAEYDYNRDGRTDTIGHYDEVGVTVEEESDVDFDGDFDSRTIFRNGVRMRTEEDTDGNGVVDMRYFYENGAVARIEQVDHVYGHVVRIDHLGPFFLERSEIDLDRDGFLEMLRTYDRFGEITNTETRARP